MASEEKEAWVKFPAIIPIALCNGDGEDGHPEELLLLRIHGLKAGKKLRLGVVMVDIFRKR
jgi:hypothetical protein